MGRAPAPYLQADFSAINAGIFLNIEQNVLKRDWDGLSAPYLQSNFSDINAGIYLYIEQNLGAKFRTNSPPLSPG